MGGGDLVGGGGARSCVPVGEVAAATAEAAAVMDGRHTLVERPAPTAAPRCPRAAPPSLAPNRVRGMRAARPLARLHLGAPADSWLRGTPATLDCRGGLSWTGLAEVYEIVTRVKHMRPDMASWSEPLCEGEAGKVASFSRAAVRGCSLGHVSWCGRLCLTFNHTNTTYTTLSEESVVRCKTRTIIT